MLAVVRKFFAERSGATGIEYGLIGALISVAVIGGATLVGNGVTNLFTDVTTEYTTATNPEE